MLYYLLLPIVTLLFMIYVMIKSYIIKFNKHTPENHKIYTPFLTIL